MENVKVTNKSLYEAQIEPNVYKRAILEAKLLLELQKTELEQKLMQRMDEDQEPERQRPNRVQKEGSVKSERQLHKVRKLKNQLQTVVQRKTRKKDLSLLKYQMTGALYHRSIVKRGPKRKGSERISNPIHTQRMQSTFFTYQRRSKGLYHGIKLSRLRILTNDNKNGQGYKNQCYRHNRLPQQQSDAEQCTTLERSNKAKLST
ncbi:hypothetical protein OXYTRIMIC_232 [Oxytricha trifallax]|uniref:Uncharacterized protein n=1 Tax=Oxytricha trifallax TaxID=1172189 RepID=A0A073HZC7_9SPIT|nr:hypothetical protein OXYTRIMIC_232 [Oxytricha trifallax]